MRFMIIIKSNEQVETGALPDERLLTEMGRYNEELVKAGVMLAGEGLLPSEKGAKVRFANGKTTVIDGPFPQAKELIAGFWLMQTRNRAEAVEWVKRMPNPNNEEYEVEIRQVAEFEDLGPGVTPEVRAQEERLRSQLQSNS